MAEKKRFGLGAQVRIKMPGMNGEVTSLDTEPTVLGEYYHTVKTQYGERRELGCNLELIPKHRSRSSYPNVVLNRHRSASNSFVETNFAPDIPL